MATSSCNRINDLDLAVSHKKRTTHGVVAIQPFFCRPACVREKRLPSTSKDVARQVFVLAQRLQPLVHVGTVDQHGLTGAVRRIKADFVQ